MQLIKNNCIYSPYWEICKGSLLPFKINESEFSEEAIFFLENIRSIENIVPSIYLRGSVIENLQPFHGSDIDIFVVYEGDLTCESLPNFRNFTTRELDIKFINKNKLKEDQVFYALLVHRSVHIGGPKIKFENVKTDREFAWKHWIKYFPSGLPNELDCSKVVSVIHFKQLVRSFGVLLFLDQNKFTRDINTCIDYSLTYGQAVIFKLNSLKKSLEAKQNKKYDIKEIKNILSRSFDILY